MFSNHLSTRELFSGSQSTQENYQNDFSQLQHAQLTQFDMSQPMSQDFFSQDQYSAGSNSQSQGRRAPVIDKYISKPSLFRSNSQSKLSTLSCTGLADNKTLPRKSSFQSTTYQQQFVQQKQKAKERDERDMLSSIVSMVRECSDEVKQNLRCMRSAEVDSEDTLKSSIKSLTDSLEESSSKILKAVKDRDDHANQLTALHKEIRQKNERIQELLQTKMSLEKQSSCSPSSLIESVKTFIIEQQGQTEQKIQKLLESTQEQLKLTKELGSSHRSGMEENNKHFLDMKYTNTRQVQDIEKRFLDELVTIRDDFDRQKRDLESFFRNQIQCSQQKHLRDIEQHVQKSMVEGLKQASDKRDELLVERHSELKAMGKSQHRDLEKYIKSQTSEQTKQIIKQSQDICTKQHFDLEKKIDEKLESISTDQKKFIDENRSTLSELKRSVSEENSRPWQNKNVPKMIQDKLNELHNYHQSEIKRLEAEIETQRKKNAEEKVRSSSNCLESTITSNLQNVYCLEQSDPYPENVSTRTGRASVMFKNGPGLLSPRPPQGTSWNSRSLFCRPNPSPVATVLPQRKSMQENVVTVKNAIQATQALQPTVDTGLQTRQLRSRYRQDQGTIFKDTTAGQKFERFVSEAAVACERNIANVDSVESNVLQHADAIKSQPAKKGRDRRKAGKKHCAKSKKKRSKNPEQSPATLVSIAKESVNYVENQREQHTCNKILINRNKSPIVHNSSSVLSSSNIFDFHEELSPGPVLKKRNKTSSIFVNQTPSVSEIKSKWFAASDSVSTDTSANSSPSLSVADLFIRTNTKDETQSFNKKDENPSSVGFAALSDFLSTPNLTELVSEEKEVSVTSSKSFLKNSRPLRRIAAKRKLCDFQPQLEVIQHSLKSTTC